MVEETQKRNSLLELTLIILAAVAITVGFSYWMKSGPGLKGNATAGLKVGESAPMIKAAGWINGEPPSSLDGRVVVVNAWFTACPYCHQLAPELVKTHQSYSDRGVVFIGLTFDDDRMLGEIEAAVKSMKTTWPNGYGAIETLREFRAEYFPAVWVIGADGEITWNKDSTQSLDLAIEEALTAAGNG